MLETYYRCSCLDRRLRVRVLYFGSHLGTFPPPFNDLQRYAAAEDVFKGDVKDAGQCEGDLGKATWPVYFLILTRIRQKKGVKTNSSNGSNSGRYREKSTATKPPLMATVTVDGVDQMLRQFKELGLEPVIGGDWILLPWPIIMALIGILCYFVSDLSTPKRRLLLLFILIKLGFQLNLYIGNVMIDMYVGLYALEKARQGTTIIKNVGGQVFQICGDTVGKTAKGDPFFACDVCSFPVCRTCDEYER
ncbi:hypothetical protein L2E82_45943 [Cichorium intybus]|uniref:Uncharacterized protein n=1 Tax=Cichorium intybus TaxID=13427 RepID=A0ACB8ZYS8_CICIN|nr:hypothetical protein L2E82_45943 [Cichorium intybus]